MANEHDLTLTRVLDAPREKVWAAWTDQDKIKNWWGPSGVTIPTSEWDNRPGGKINIVMLAGPEMGPMAGQEWPMTGEVREVDEPNKLVFASSPVMNGKPVMNTLTTVTFEDQNGKTALTVHVEVSDITPEAAGPLQGMEQGWNQQLDKLVVFVK